MKEHHGPFEISWMLRRRMFPRNLHVARSFPFFLLLVVLGVFVKITFVHLAQQLGTACPESKAKVPTVEERDDSSWQLWSPEVMGQQPTSTRITCAAWSSTTSGNIVQQSEQKASACLTVRLVLLVRLAAEGADSAHIPTSAWKPC